MNGLFSTLTFMQPLILSGLLALPLLWYILRITPPAPKTVFFPATRFLIGLTSDDQTPQSSPWWILLLRLLMAALIIIALARPVLNPAETLPGNGDIRIVLDNSWASAQSWTLEMQAAEEALAQAGRENRQIYILPTTPPLGESQTKQYGPLSLSDARSILRGLRPHPWPADYNSLAEVIKKNKERKSIYTLWFGHGLDEGNIKNVIGLLQSQGGLSYISPSNEKLPLLLRPSETALTQKQLEQYGDTRIDIDAAKETAQDTPVTVQALGENNDIIDIQNTVLKNDSLPQTIFFKILPGLENKTTRFSIMGRQGAGSLFLLDDNAKKRKVGIATTTQDESAAPLIEESFYIKRALEPYADIITSDPNDLIQQSVSVIIMPDIAAMPTETLNALEKWVEKGGLLLRFAGEHMADLRGDQFLLPVLLRNGGRSLSGSLSWNNPQKITAFAEDSPLYGLEIPDDVTVKQQVLADPAQDLDGKVWARLSDGTPFITAKTQDKGLIVLIHTSANAEWSNFALSGLYVNVLKRIIRMAGKSRTTVETVHTALDPLLIMDGYGGLTPPSAAVQPLPVDRFDKIIPSSIHPPGLYGRGGQQYALNLGTNLPELKVTAASLPLSVIKGEYETTYETDIMPFTLYLALLLFCIDWIIMIALSGNAFRLNFMRTASVALSLCILFLPYSAHASDEQDLEYASGFYLAYIQTGSEEIDALTQRGLESLADVLTQRTSVEPEGVAALDPENDTLSFFPIIYWSIGEDQKRPSAKAIRNIQDYLDHGGTILFDTRDQNRSSTSTQNTNNARALQLVTLSLNIPPIIPVPDDHVLGRAFYLLKDYPGRYSAGTLWVEQHSAQGRDNVSSVIIGSNDWVGSWADSYKKSSMNRYRADYDAQQQEMALRFGVNLVMYALTGNYKADQVHIPHILERLDQ